MFFKLWHKSYHRALLEELLRENASLLRGKILDIGSKNRRYDHLFDGKVTAIDLVPDAQRKISFGDIQKGLEFTSESFDGILCLEVFEYLENYQSAVCEIHRLLKLGGYALVSIPFLYAEHEDKVRITASYAIELFGDFREIELTRIGNGWVVAWDILRKKVKRVSYRGLRYLGLMALVPAWLALSVLGIDKETDDMYSGSFLVLRK